MEDIVKKNFHVILKSRPGPNGEPRVDNFEYKPCDYPAEIGHDQVLIETLYLSVDPIMRCLMNEDSGVSYAQSWTLGETVLGFGVGVIQSSNDENLKKGTIVTSVGLDWPWQLYFISHPNKLQVIDKNVTGERVSLTLSCFGLTGLTSLLGIWEKGHIINGKDTFVVSGAAGACGSLAGQIARLEGCKRVIGICGSDTKCEFLVKTLGFDDAINYTSQCVKERLHSTCPDGIDIYFDNVGGEISDCVIKQMNLDGRVILCGQISQYNKDVPYPPPISDTILDVIVRNKIQRERFLVLNYTEKFQVALQQLAHWFLEGKLQVKETIEEGLENAGSAFVKMMRGDNIGKQLVQVIRNP